jgi:hypothetical protein
LLSLRQSSHAIRGLEARCLDVLQLFESKGYAQYRLILGYRRAISQPEAAGALLKPDH